VNFRPKMSSKIKLVSSVIILNLFRNLRNLLILIKIDFIECKLSGQQTFVQIRHSPETEIIANLTDLKIELLNKDYNISFLFRLEKIVCTSMHIILLELIDRCQSNVLQTHDKIIYTFQTLIQNISNSLKIQWLGDFQ
jgi:hypothetical protein